MRAGELAVKLANEADIVARELLPAGKREGREWKVGSISGDGGKSLCVCVDGAKKGRWKDFATGDGGDLLDLWMQSRGINLRDAMKEAKSYMGIKDDYDKYVRHLLELNAVFEKEE